MSARVACCEFPREPCAQGASRFGLVQSLGMFLGMKALRKMVFLHFLLHSKFAK